jgi:hypothetical protein
MQALIGVNIDPARHKLIKNFIKAGTFFKDYKQMKEEFSEKIVTFKTVFESEVLINKSKLSVEYEKYIDEIYNKVKVWNIEINII